VGAAYPWAALPPLAPFAEHRPFFFSSRRRHTRSKRDWSSDVCSSDLSAQIVAEPARRLVARDDRGDLLAEQLDVAALAGASLARSEERRVGKECRPRGAKDEYKKYGNRRERRRRIFKYCTAAG